MQDQQAELIWRENDLPVSVRFDDPYFTIENGLAETRHVFLKGNGLPGRLCNGFRIAELGFGTGLNLLATLAAWRASGLKGRFHYTSFEAYPMSPGDMRRAQGGFPELAAIASEFHANWTSDAEQVKLPDLDFHLVRGDVRDTLPKWQGQADAWFLDGFSPAKNPEMWQEDLLLEVARHTAQGGTAATYTAAGAVRRGLEAAGFTVVRQPGFGRKRHMTTALKGGT